MACDYYHWFALSAVPQVGNVTFRRLISHFASPDKVLSASAAELSSVPGISSSVAHSIVTTDTRRFADDQSSRLEKSGARLITCSDSLYPRLLLEIIDAPPYLYLKGSIPESFEAVALVGSRTASAYGLSTAERLAGELSVKGVAVVSGLARGVDAAAHDGALKAGGLTIGVLGCGVDRIYPVENRRLYREMTEKGAILSEFPLGTAPLAEHFPRRNRIISGMSRGVVIVEAAEKSGSLITANYALEQGREVFAVPGNVTQANSRGGNWLIKQGAKLVESADDILNEFPPSAPSAKSPPFQPPLPELEPDERPLYSALSESPRQIDQLVMLTGLTPASLSAMLLRLELRGLIQQLPGKLFALT